MKRERGQLQDMYNTDTKEAVIKVTEPLAGMNGMIGEHL